jgi:4-coumarate--CoA ligase
VDTDTGLPIDPASDGELEVRGPQVMQGYLDEPAATDAMLRDGGWLRTGDLGHLDANGNVVIVDRIKELIKVKGLQVAPTEIEDALRSHPAVADAAVVGRPDSRDGERPVAFVVTCAKASPDDLSTFLATRVAPYKLPAEITPVDSLPRTPSGKLLRRSLPSGHAHER